MVKKQNCRWNFDAIYHSSRDISISGLGGHIAISNCRSLSQSFESTFFELVMVENLRIAVGILMLFIIVPEKQVLPVWAAILLFPVVARCCYPLGTLSMTSLLSES